VAAGSSLGRYFDPHIDWADVNLNGHAGFFLSFSDLTSNYRKICQMKEF
jgi:hypothetical protein